MWYTSVHNAAMVFGVDGALRIGLIFFCWGTPQYREVLAKTVKYVTLRLKKNPLEMIGAKLILVGN